MSPSKPSTLSLHDALPIYAIAQQLPDLLHQRGGGLGGLFLLVLLRLRSEEHTSELQSRGHLVCRLLLEKKKKESDFMLADASAPVTSQRCIHSTNDHNETG